MINKDNLVDGPFGSNACYEQTFDQNGIEVKTWLCFGSGFTSSTFMDKDSDIVKETLETSPELYKDLMHVDKIIEYGFLLLLLYLKKVWYLQMVPVQLIGNGLLLRH